MTWSGAGSVARPPAANVWEQAIATLRDMARETLDKVTAATTAEGAFMAAISNEEGDCVDTESITKTEQNQNQPGAVQKNGRQKRKWKNE